MRFQAEGDINGTESPGEMEPFNEADPFAGLSFGIKGGRVTSVAAVTITEDDDSEWDKVESALNREGCSVCLSLLHIAKNRTHWHHSFGQLWQAGVLMRSCNTWCITLMFCLSCWLFS